MKKKYLEIALSKLGRPDSPKVELEQYVTPSSIAAEILHFAFLNGDIEGKSIFDLGCGNGVFAIGSKLMGAKDATGVDIDGESLKISMSNAENLGVEVEFIKSDIKDFSGKCDTVFQNPPFGMRGEKHSDRLFILKAIECGRKVYSLHRGGYENESGSKTREFLTKFIEKNGGNVVQIKAFKFDVPYMFKFHRKPKVSYSVDLFVIEKR